MAIKLLYRRTRKTSAARRIINVKIIVGFENSAASDYIFADLESAGIVADADILVVSATDMGAFDVSAESEIEDILNPPANATWQKEISQSDRDYLRAKLDDAHHMASEKESELTVEAESAVGKLKKRFPSANVRFSVVRESPSTAILQAARTNAADLIVVGSQNASRLSHFFLGSVSQKVMRQSDVSVRISRAHAISNMDNLRIIVGFDGSADSQVAVDAVARRSWPAGTTVRVLTVAEEKSLGLYLSNLMIGMWGESAKTGNGENENPDVVQRLAESAAARLSEAGVTAEAIKMDGDPKDALLNMAEEWNADAIFIGARGHRAIQAESLGAVASVMAARANCSIEIVRG